MATILVVDDHPDLREVLVRMLEMHGHTVAGCESGESALQLLAGSTPDVMVVDERMSGLSGLEVVQRLRKLPHHKDLFLIVWSADMTFQPKALAGGADDFWVKGSEDMLESIDRLEDTLRAWRSRSDRRPSPGT
jgi:two-component system response regulator MprA